jgi:pimeloyl-ACP methyl ester carboxylesterase
LVILHGNGSSVADFLASNLVGQLAERHTVYLFDRPGYGHTDGGMGWWTAGKQARLLDRALAALNITGEIVLAHSWATLAALALAKIRPVAGLVLVSGYYFPSARLDVIAAALPAAPVSGTIWRWTVGPWVGRMLIQPMFQILFSPASVPARFKAMFPVDLAVRPGSLKASASESVFMLPTAFSLARHYATITAPVMAVAGAEDQVVDPSQSKRLRDAVPGAGLIIVAGAGHMLHHTDPAEILSAVQTLTNGPGKALESGPVPESLDPAP